MIDSDSFDLLFATTGFTRSTLINPVQKENSALALVHLLIAELVHFESLRFTELVCCLEIASPLSWLLRNASGVIGPINDKLTMSSAN
jgi:hypothetical protein